jgi:hypothetical protein
MTYASFTTIMNIWVDKDNAAVADYLGIYSTREAMKTFKRNYLYNYAIEKIGHLPHRHEHYEMLKNYWRKERTEVQQLQ